MNDTIKTSNDTIDISLNISKQRIRIDNDENKVLYLSLSDPNIGARFAEALPEMENFFKDNKKTENTSEEKSNREKIDEYGKMMKAADDKIKSCIDYIFDSNVSEVCAGNASMFSATDGVMLFEKIIDTLSGLYAETLSREMKAFSNRMKKHTEKYMQMRKSK